MKICPNCQSQYTDDTLRFCLQDGSLLVESSSAPTVAFTEQETVVAGRPTTAPGGGFQRPTNPSIAEPVPQKSRFLIVALLLLSVVLLAFTGVGVWLLYVGGSPYSRTNPMVVNANTDRPATASKPVTDTSANKPTVAATPAATSSVDNTKVKSDVENRIKAWQTGLESLDLDDFMSNYAESVDYYNGRGTTRAAVRDDKSRAFAKFDSMDMTISNMTITPGPGDSRAAAVFDKEWVFTNKSGDRNAGKVTQQLILEKIDGKWLIVLEKDLKVIRRPGP
jgi:hypothetical protein